MMKKLGDSGTLAIFAISIFVSAALLFMVQPMIAKMILPRMGGAAQVWAFCMVFFQSLLLIGYLYTWVFQRFVANLRTQLIVHVVVVGAAFISLPLALKQIDAISVVDSPMLWLGTALGLTVGLPFFVTSTTSPLLQAWFARTGHPQSGDPYHLYAASNLGSMLWLLAPARADGAPANQQPDLDGGLRVIRGPDRRDHLPVVGDDLGGWRAGTNERWRCG